MESKEVTLTGAPRLQSLRRRKGDFVRRNINISRDLDLHIVERMKERGTSYSNAAEELLYSALDTNPQAVGVA